MSGSAPLIAKNPVIAQSRVQSHRIDFRNVEAEQWSWFLGAATSSQSGVYSTPCPIMPSPLSLLSCLVDKSIGQWTQVAQSRCAMYLLFAIIGFYQRWDSTVSFPSFSSQLLRIGDYRLLCNLSSGPHRLFEREHDKIHNQNWKSW